MIWWSRPLELSFLFIILYLLPLTKRRLIWCLRAWRNIHFEFRCCFFLSCKFLSDISWLFYCAYRIIFGIRGFIFNSKVVCIIFILFLLHFILHFSTWNTFELRFSTQKFFCCLCCPSLFLFWRWLRHWYNASCFSFA